MAKLLVVDDDLQVVQLLKSALEGEGHEVVVGYDGQMALSLAKTQRPNLIIMDFNMPLANGLRALEFIRRTPETESVPVIFLTGAQTEIFAAALQRMGRVRYLAKPVLLEDFLSLVRQTLAEKTFGTAA
jgi:CheY-like chemotaxis protein